MSRKILLHNATLINEGKRFVGSVVIVGALIEAIYRGEVPTEVMNACQVTDVTGKWIIPGVIDDQVHLREPGLTHKGTIYSESRAAVAGGVTSFMDMPNTLPQTVTQEAWQWKMERAAASSLVNYSFYMGATNDNIATIKQVDVRRVCGIKLFMGSSTGNMLVDNEESLIRLFSESPLLVAAHCEKEEVIARNRAHYTALYGEELPIEFHSLIRNEEACYASSSHAVELATRYGGRLHLLHLSTAKEMCLLSDAPLSPQKRITAEVCVHHLYFNDSFYPQLGNRIKWNPSIKSESDREALLAATRSNKIDIIATDHAPHTWEEKQGSCLKAASGGPLLQHSLQAMLRLAKRGECSLEEIVTKMCHAPADLFQIVGRGYLRPGYAADITIIDPHTPYTVTPENIYSKCGWSPFDGETFDHTIDSTYVNGNLAYHRGEVKDTWRGEALLFDR